MSVPATILQLAAKHPEIVELMSDAAGEALKAKDLGGAWRAARIFFFKESGKRIAKLTASKAQQLAQKLGK